MPTTIEPRIAPDVAATGAAATTPASALSWLAERSHGPMRPGSVLIHAPVTAFQAPGGGENQLVQTARYLERLGVPVRPFSPWTDRLEDARLLHLFGMSREGQALARVARARGVPVVLSPICWFEPHALRALAPDRLRGAGDLLKWTIRRVLPRWPSWRRELLSLADAILPNSEAEARQLDRLFGIGRSRTWVVPNGVEDRFAQADPSAFQERFGDAPFVLYAGRIEPRKNVLRLVEGCRVAGLPLVVVGNPPPGQETYAEACRRAGQGCARWLAAVDHADPLLASAYAAARVFALPSWFETPGLAALEAVLAGCSLVITPFGCTREYFGDQVIYVRPDASPARVARALRQAWDQAPGPATLVETVRARCSWWDVARKTAGVYDEVAS